MHTIKSMVHFTKKLYTENLTSEQTRKPVRLYNTAQYFIHIVIHLSAKFPPGSEVWYNPQDSDKYTFSLSESSPPPTNAIKSHIRIISPLIILLLLVTSDNFHPFVTKSNIWMVWSRYCTSWFHEFFTYLRP